MERKTKQNDMDDRYFLFGLLNAFANRLQTVGDTFFEEVSWKQWLVLIGINLYEEPPTMNEVSQVIGSSHQNVKQILIKLEKLGFVELYTDEKDRRKVRIRLTAKMDELDKKYQDARVNFMSKLFEGISEEDIAITKKTLLAIEENLIQIKK